VQPDTGSTGLGHWAAKIAAVFLHWDVVMKTNWVVEAGKGGRLLGGPLRASRKTPRNCAIAAMMGVGALCLSGGSVLAATGNSEAASPQLSSSSVRPLVQKPVAPKIAPKAEVIVARSLPAPKANPVNVNVEGDGVPDRSWGGALTASPHKATPAPIPVVSAEKPIAISASEPELTSRVRPQDVAAFQKIGAPYQAKGMWYVPAHEPDYDEKGVASWYGAQFQGQKTANGELFDMNVVTAAHPTLPIPSLVEVTNLENGRSLVVRVNDRGPFVGNRLIDLSARGAQLLGFEAKGSAQVRVRYVGAASPEPMVTAQTLSPVRSYAMAKPPAQALPHPAAIHLASKTSEAASPDKGAPVTGDQAFVQLGVFAQAANAQRVREKVSHLGAVRIVPQQSAEGGTLYKVLIRPADTGPQAKEKVQAALASGFSGARV
jgi:rare lipoprotein A